MTDRSYRTRWLGENHRKCLRSALEAQRGYDAMKDKSTSYARAMAELAEAHRAAAEVYRRALIGDDE